jgi:hypothetical protein
VETSESPDIPLVAGTPSHLDTPVSCTQVLQPGQALSGHSGQMVPGGVWPLPSSSGLCDVLGHWPGKEARLQQRWTASVTFLSRVPCALGQ